MHCQKAEVQRTYFLNINEEPASTSIHRKKNQISIKIYQAITNKQSQYLNQKKIEQKSDKKKHTQKN